jgi:hypothetical protein
VSRAVQRGRGQVGEPAAVVEFERVAHAAVGPDERRSDPGDAQKLVEAAGPALGRERRPGSSPGVPLRVIDAGETEDLHQRVPRGPQESGQHDSAQAADRETHAHGYQENRSDDQARAEALEERAIAVGAQHARQVMAQGPEGAEVEDQLLHVGPAGGEQDQGQQEQRHAQDQAQIEPRTSDPRRARG